MSEKEWDMDKVQSEVAELELMAYAARNLWLEANGDGAYSIGNVRKWVDNSALPFFDAVAYRMKELAAKFRDLLWEAYSGEADFGEKGDLAQLFGEAYSRDPEKLRAVLDELVPEEEPDPEVIARRQEEKRQYDLIGDACKLTAWKHGDQKQLESLAKLGRIFKADPGKVLTIIGGMDEPPCGDNGTAETRETDNA